MARHNFTYRNGAFDRSVPADSGAGTGRFRTQGIRILDRAGNAFVPKGFNVGGGIYANGNSWPDFAFDNAFAVGMAGWGANTVRIVNYSTSRYSWAVRSASAGYSGQTGVAAVHKLANDLTAFWRARGFIVITECHDLTSPGFTETHVEEVKQFWEVYADRWKNDDMVWFNIANEPNMDDANVWRSFHDDALGRIRPIASNVVIVDSFGYAGDTGQDWQGAPLPRGFSPENAPYLATKHGNVVLAQHNYGNKNVFTTSANETAYINAVHNAGVPLLIGELGFPVDPSGSGSGFWQQEYNAFFATIAAAPPKGVGILWWAVNHIDTYDVHVGGAINPFAAGVTLTEGGQAFKNYLASG